jgi:hypothetical protein
MMLKFKKMLRDCPRSGAIAGAMWVLLSGDAVAQTPAGARSPRIVLPDEVAAWDAAVRANPEPADGYRVQLYLGDLQSSRQLRADLRKTVTQPVYILDLTPNYRVCIGDFRDRWSAEFERRSWLAAYPTATVIPSPIAPPALPAAEGESD